MLLCKLLLLRFPFYFGVWRWEIIKGSLFANSLCTGKRSSKTTQLKLKHSKCSLSRNLEQFLDSS